MSDDLFSTGHSVPFPVQRWVRPNFHYKIKAYDTLLPQDDPNKPHRTLELDYKRTLYQYSGKDKELPGSIDKLPEDEEFSTKYFLVRFAVKFSKYLVHVTSYVTGMSLNNSSFPVIHKVGNLVIFVLLKLSK